MIKSHTTHPYVGNVDKMIAQADEDGCGQDRHAPDSSSTSYYFDKGSYCGLYWGHKMHHHHYLDPNSKNMWLDMDKTKTGFVPCPGDNVSAEFYGPGYKSLQCEYNNVDDKYLRSLAAINKQNGFDNTSANAPGAQYKHLADVYCTGDTADAIIGGTTENPITCADFVTEHNLMEDHCSKGDNIRTDKIECKTSLSSAVFDKLSADWCANNPSAEWCGCYNNTHGTCSGNPKAAGCADTDAIIDSLPAEQRTLFSGTQRYCVSPSCMNATVDMYIPNVDNDCNLKTIICGSNLAIGGDIQQKLNIKTNCDGKEDDISGGGPPLLSGFTQFFSIKDPSTWDTHDKELLGGGSVTALASCASSALLLIMLL